MKDLFLYFSAFIPMYLLVLVNLTIELLNENVHFNVLNTIVLSSMSLLIVLGIIGLLWNIEWNRDTAREIKIVSKQNTTDEHFLGYFALFVLFALSFELTKISMFVVSLLIIAMIGIVYVGNKLFYINPLLNILGFKFYEVEYIRTDEAQKSVQKTQNLSAALSENTHTARIFSRIPLEVGKTYRVKLKNENFSFAEKTPLQKEE